MKELIIDKKTNITRIKNKEEYTSLIIRTKINPRKLEGFINVKELTIDYKSKENNYNEVNINKLPFKDTIEKLIFKKIYRYGIVKNKSNYKLDLPNLKSITFPSYMRDYNNYYLEDIEKLEEIIFDVDESKNIYLNDTIYLYSNKFKRIIIKYKNEEYIVEPDYLIDYIDDLNIEDDIITLEYSPDNDIIESSVEINTRNNKIEKNNIYDLSSSGDNINIPDYITELDDYNREEVSKITFNAKLLEYLYSYKEIIDIRNLDELKIIEIKTNNEMSLFPSIKIYVKDYGILVELYIDKNLLYLEYRDKTITINSKGEITKTEKEYYIEEYMNELDLKKYTLEELENYVSFLKLLKLSENNEYKNAMNVVEKELIKKLTK